MELTNLKGTIELRFNKLEKTVEKMHNEFKLKLFDGIVDNLEEGEGGKNVNGSLSLDYEKEKPNLKKDPWGGAVQMK